MKASEPTRSKIETSQIRRLATLTDCVYAVSLVLVIQWLPFPSESSLDTGRIWVFDLFVEFAGNLLAILIAVVFLILYWLRSTDHLARLQRSDGTHATLSILSVFFLLLLLYVVRVGGEVAPTSARASESFAVALIGLAASGALRHANRKGLVRPGISSTEMEGVLVESWTEPLTALLTLPVAFAGELWWNLAWLLYIPVSWLLKRRAAG